MRAAHDTLGVVGRESTEERSRVVTISPRDVADLEIPRERVGRVIALESRRVNVAAAAGVGREVTGVLPVWRPESALHQLRFDFVRIEAVDPERDVVDARHAAGPVPNDRAADVADVDGRLISGEPSGLPAQQRLVE